MAKYEIKNKEIITITIKQRVCVFFDVFNCFVKPI